MTDLELAKKRLSQVKCRILTSGCKIAITSIESNGYATISFKNKKILLHRLVAFVYLGLDLSNDKLLALHKRECPNRHCFNEEHIYVGSYKDNAIDKSAIGHHPSQQKKLCKNGHPLDWSQKDSKTGKYYRSCSTCKKISNSKRRKV